VRMLIIDFKLDMTTREYEQLAETVAPEIARVKGLIRKTWIWNPQTLDAGGVYLFEDQDSVERYLDGPMVARLREMNQVKELRARQLDVLEQPSSITRGIDPRHATATSG
jgi:hypothetical protein